MRIRLRNSPDALHVQDQVQVKSRQSAKRASLIPELNIPLPNILGENFVDIQAPFHPYSAHIKASSYQYQLSKKPIDTEPDQESTTTPRDGISFLGPCQRQSAELPLASHPRCDQLLPRLEIRDEFPAAGVAHVAVAGRDCLLGAAGPVLGSVDQARFMPMMRGINSFSHRQ
jgi:hypothetical protein